MYFKTTKENLLNDFIINSGKTINMYMDNMRASLYSDTMKASELLKMQMASNGLVVLARQKEVGEFYNEIEQLFQCNGGEAFEMTDPEMLELCYRAGFHY